MIQQNDIWHYIEIRRQNDFSGVIMPLLYTTNLILKFVALQVNKVWERKEF